MATALGICSLVFLAKGHLTHRHLLARASRTLRQLLVLATGLCASILGLLGATLLLGGLLVLDPWPHEQDADTSVSQEKRDARETSLSFDHAPNWGLQATVMLLAFVCLVAAAFSAHGVAGFVLHSTFPPQQSKWAFFQPFQVCSNCRCRIEIRPDASRPDHLSCESVFREGHCSLPPRAFHGACLPPPPWVCLSRPVYSAQACYKIHRSL